MQGIVNSDGQRGFEYEPPFLTTDRCAAELLEEIHELEDDLVRKRCEYELVCNGETV